MSKPDAPTPPNPYTTAAAQTGTNVSTAVANAYLNNVNQVSPTGTLSYDQTGMHQWSDPATGQTYSIPTFTATQQLTDQGRAIRTRTSARSTIWPAWRTRSRVGSPACSRRR